jgi:hypothetical protein
VGKHLGSQSTGRFEGVPKTARYFHHWIDSGYNFINDQIATRKHEQTGEVAFFNNIVSRYMNAKASGTLEPPYVNEKGRLQPPAFVSI